MQKQYIQNLLNSPISFTNSIILSGLDRKSTRLNASHVKISLERLDFCLFFPAVVVLAWLKIGHCHLTHAYLLKREDQPECLPCDCACTILTHFNRLLWIWRHSSPILRCPRHENLIWQSVLKVLLNLWKKLDYLISFEYIAFACAFTLRAIA